MCDSPTSAAVPGPESIRVALPLPSPSQIQPDSTSASFPADSLLQVKRSAVLAAAGQYRLRRTASDYRESVMGGMLRDWALA